MGFNEDKLAEGYRQKGAIGIDLAMELDNLRRHLAQYGWTFTISPGDEGGWHIEVLDLTSYIPLWESGQEPTILHAVTKFKGSEACPPDRENM